MSTLTAPPRLLERLRLQAHVRRLITDYGFDAAAEIVAAALDRELRNPTLDLTRSQVDLT